MANRKKYQTIADECHDLVTDTFQDFGKMEERRKYALIVYQNLPDFLAKCLDQYYRLEWHNKVKEGKEFELFLQKKQVNWQIAKTYAWYRYGMVAGSPFPKKATPLDQIPKPVFKGLDDFYNEFQAN